VHPVPDSGEVHANYGECVAATLYAPAGNYGDVPIPGMVVVDAFDDPWIHARLITRPDFGCVLFVAKGGA
jgi:hypothetical protein